MDMPQTASRPASKPDSHGLESQDWYALRHNKCGQARHRLIERHMPFAKMLSAKLFANRVIQEAEFDDYKHWGIEGLIAAIDRFDPERSVSFEAFAAKRIQGAILDQVDTLSDRAAQISMRSRMRKQRMHSLSDTVDARTDTDTLFNGLVEVAVGLALGYMLQDTGMVQSPEAISHHTDVYRSIELAQMRKRIQALVELLPEQERMIVKYHYFFGFQFEQIAEQFQLTRGRISQIHRQALHRMREMQRQTAGLNLQI